MTPVLEFCRWLQDSQPGVTLRESTWGFPILGALHVLCIAWFGGAWLMGALRRPGFAAMERAGLAAILITGAVLFYIEPVKCYQSVSFRAKLALLVAGLSVRLVPLSPQWSVILSLLLWSGVIAAARGIAFF